LRQAWTVSRESGRLLVPGLDLEPQARCPAAIEGDDLLTRHSGPTGEALSGAAGRRLPTSIARVIHVVMSERTTLYLRGMPRHIVREAKAAAARRGSTLASLVSDSLARSLGEGDAGEPPGELGDDRLWYERRRPELLARYRGEYLAVIDRQVVDHDRDFSALAARVFARHGDRPVFMPRVQEKDEPAWLRSPRRARR
jgi:hypothetical protein